MVDNAITSPNSDTLYTASHFRHSANAFIADRFTWLFGDINQRSSENHKYTQETIRETISETDDFDKKVKLIELMKNNDKDFDDRADTRFKVVSGVILAAIGVGGFAVFKNPKTAKAISTFVK